MFFKCGIIKCINIGEKGENIGEWDKRVIVVNRKEFVGDRGEREENTESLLDLNGCRLWFLFEGKERIFNEIKLERRIE